MSTRPPLLNDDELHGLLSGPLPDGEAFIGRGATAVRNFYEAERTRLYEALQIAVDALVKSRDGLSDYTIMTALNHAATLGVTPTKP